MMRKSLLVLIVLLTLFTPLDRGTNGPNEYGPGDDTPDITSLDLESFQRRLKEDGQNGNTLGLSEHTLTPTPVTTSQLIITNGTIIDGTGADPIPNGVVIIRGNRILAVGRMSDFDIPPDATVIDATGKTIMPGIINAHVHYSYDPATRRHFLVDGVTATCDLGSPLRALPNFEREFTRQNQPAARGFRAGPMMTVPGGYPGTFPGFAWHYEVATPDEARAAVEDLLGRGVDVIKIALEPGHPQHPWPILSPEQVEAIVEIAHVQDIPVRAHVRQATMLDIALAGGVDVIEHVPLPFCLEAELKQMLADDALHLTKLPELETQLSRMAKQGTILIPTLEENIWVINDLPMLKPEERQLVTDFILGIVQHFHKMGGIIALGNDYGNLGVQLGMPLREMELLLDAGLTPMEVIEAGTRYAAHVSGHGDELGTLEPGKLADIIVIDGNPLIDIKALDRVTLVIKDGKIVYTSEEM